MRGEALVWRNRYVKTSGNDPPAPALKPARPALLQRGDARDHGRHGPAATHARCRECAGAGGSVLGHHPQSRGRNRSANAAMPASYDIAALGDAAVASGNVAIPLVKALTAEVEKKRCQAAGYVHWGATSQDIIDTALVLDLRAAIDVLLNDLDRAISALFDNRQPTPQDADRGAHMAAASVADAVRTESRRLCGGAGAFARPAEALARRGAGAAIRRRRRNACGARQKWPRCRGETRASNSSCRCRTRPWHSHRDRLGEVASAFAILAGTCGKIARDVSLLMQTEIGEVSEPAAPGRGGSSTMPHKRNPVASARGARLRADRAASRRVHSRRRNPGA